MNKTEFLSVMRLRCKRCSHSWIRRSPDHPRVCPKCKRPDWDVGSRDTPEFNARKATAKAIRDRVLVRKPCEKCGDKAEAHHPDYSKPLDVKWLCKQHHGQAHRGRKFSPPWGERREGAKP